jgi:hypothetical protein
MSNVIQFPNQARLEQCGLRFTTVSCCECNVGFDVDSDHPLWPDGPYYCHKHDPNEDDKKRRRKAKFKIRVPKGGKRR